MGYLEKIICEIDKHNISVISFDIYDTLLFRMVRHPERIYDKTYEMNPKMFPDYIDAREWREIRMKAEHIAREKRRNSEITLDDIYSCLPKIIQNINEIKGMEIKCEKKYSYLNKDIVNWIRLLKKEYNKKIVLTSDMYLSKSVITEILIENGLNKKWIDEMFISCDKGETKRSGKLYKIVCDELSCVPENILHIGDNRKSDYIMARTMGVKALYYPIRSEAFIRYPYTCYEVEQYGYIGDDIHTLRFLAAQNVTEQMNEQQRYWFELGAVIMGPILTCSVEWVLDVAQENNIEYIFPMMREGKFLSVLLENAKKKRGWKGIIQPMYISRKALYPALLSVLKKKDMEYNLSTHKMTVKGLFSLLSINDSIGKFAEFENYELAKTKDVFIDGESVFVQLSNYLCSQQMIQKIRQENVDADGLLWKYLCELGLDKVNYITFDVGWRGNAQNAIQRILKKSMLIPREYIFS